MDGVRMSMAIMAHPLRAKDVGSVLSQCAELEPTVVFDPEPDLPGNLAAALAAWRAAGRGGTHHLVVQDDVELCEGFVDQVLAAVASRPRDALYLFASWGSRTGEAVRAAALRGASWAEGLDPILSPQAVVLPVTLVEAFLAFAEANPGLPRDDALALRDFYVHLGIRAYISVPNLVEHAGAPSLLGHDLLLGWRKATVFGPPDAESRGWTDRAVEGDMTVPHYLAGKSYLCRRTGEEWDLTDTSAGLGDQGMPLSDQIACFHRAATGLDAVHDIVSPTVTFNFWLTAFAHGVLAKRGDPAFERPLARRAFATLFNGGMRAQLPARQMVRIAPLLEPLLEAGLRAGADSDFDL